MEARAGGVPPKLKLLLSVVGTGTGAAPPELKLPIDGVCVVGAEAVGFKTKAGARLLPLRENREEDCCPKVNPEGAPGTADIVESVFGAAAGAVSPLPTVGPEAGAAIGVILKPKPPTA